MLDSGNDLVADEERHRKNLKIFIRRMQLHGNHTQ